jgi:hypothetical protein
MNSNQEEYRVAKMRGWWRGRGDNKEGRTRRKGRESERYKKGGVDVRRV